MCQTLPALREAADTAAAREATLYAHYLEAAGKVLGARLTRNVAGVLDAGTEARLSVLLGQLLDEKDRAWAAYEQAQARRLLAVHDIAEASPGTYAVVGEAYAIQAA